MLVGLRQFHEQETLFRDLKPENILVDGSNGYLKLNDFGLQRLIDIKVRENTLTHNFTTPEYIAPELLKGHVATQATDWWQLGILM